MLNFIVHSPLFALILGPVVTVIGNYGQRLIRQYDALPPIGKQAVAIALSFVLVAIAHAFPGIVPDACTAIAATGITPDCLAGLTSKDFLTVLLTGLVAIAVKHGKQKAK
ncbi:MAG TPA: hypothetical protein VIP11_07570 [Gemmatimonadaceae bacterium]